MTYTVSHTYVDEPLPLDIPQVGNIATVTCSATGEIPIHAPGKLQISTSAVYNVIDESSNAGGPSKSGPNRVVGPLQHLPLTVQIRTPDGQLFTADQVTLGDLERFRDLRGASQGTWTYSVEGQSGSILLGKEASISNPDGRITITVEETVSSKSAPPLVSDTLDARTPGRYQFDLYRVGTFVATARPASFIGSMVGGRTLKLSDPDGVEVASSDGGPVTFAVSLATLDKSRDAQGNVRFWSLEVLPATVQIGFAETSVWAAVIATTRIHTETVNDRIEELLGLHGSKISIYGEERANPHELVARLKILDEDSAGTIDILHLLSALKQAAQDPGVDLSGIKANVAYVLGKLKADLGYEVSVSLDGVKIDTYTISVGASRHIQPSIPALRIDVAVEGELSLNMGGVPIATLSVNGNQLTFEAGVRLNSDGTFSVDSWLNDDPLNLDLSWEAVLAAGVLSASELFTLGAEGLTDYLQGQLNDPIVQRIHEFLGGIGGRVPEIMEAILGDHFTYQSMSMDGDDIVFDYIAPLEPEPKPSPNYLPIIGRSAMQLGPRAWRIMPPTLGDTWSATNLEKVDHIVVVMMENRSFDHVLGYRSQLPGGTQDDGLTPELVAFLTSKGFPIGPMDASNIANNALGLKTKFSLDPRHNVADVAHQLQYTLTDGSGRTINSPQGFVESFADVVARADPSNNVVAADVLRYYGDSDLRFTQFLADNYGYCERSFSSHPGPTFPNRMYLLSGDVQYDRNGEAIVNNNSGDNIVLSRAPTFFDLLTRKGIGWRVYESFPSVTMLRMFTRYASDNTNIVPLSRLQLDVLHGDLPAVTMIEPSMQSAPRSDDHAPRADMYNGQVFLRSVYETLRLNPAVWQKTLLIITYDEHGGFYDHVPPPIAEARTAPLVTTQGNSPQTPDSVNTASLVTSYGVRVPTFVVSPWVPAGKGPDLVLDHCSIAKTILARFCGDTKPFLSDRVHSSRSFDAYLSESSPRMNVPPSPALTQMQLEATPNHWSTYPESGGQAVVAIANGHRTIDTAPLSGKQMMAGDVDFHDLSGMVARMLGR
jgi:phospholipase C